MGIAVGLEIATTASAALARIGSASFGFISLKTLEKTQKIKDTK